MAYIEREALIKLCQSKRIYVTPHTSAVEAVQTQGKLFREAVDNAPTADVVEVVRCRDCKFWEHEDDVDFVCAKLYGYRTSDDFCSYGERRQEE